MASLTRIEAMELRNVQEVKSVKTEEICNICEIIGHSTVECPNIPLCKEMLHDQANVLETFKNLRV